MNPGLHLVEARGSPKVVFGRALIHRLVERASYITGVDHDDMVGACRFEDAVWARFAVMAVAREHKRSLAQIGRVLGDRDHTTIKHGITRAYLLEKEHPGFAELLEALRAEAAR